MAQEKTNRLFVVTGKNHQPLETWSELTGARCAAERRTAELGVPHEVLKLVGRAEIQKPTIWTDYE